MLAYTSGMAAIIKLSNGKKRFVSYDTGLRYWQILTGEIEPTDEEGAKLAYIETVYLDHTNPKTPDSYRQMHAAVLSQMAKHPKAVTVDAPLLADENSRPPEPPPKTSIAGEAARRNGTDWFNN